MALRDVERGLAIKCFGGCRSGDVAAELRRLGLLDDDAADPPPPPSDPAEIERQRQAEDRNRQRRIAAALDFWRHETVNPHGTVVERYWTARGLNLPIPPTIRISRSWLRHPEGGTRPAMIALVQHAEHGSVAIHRTWLAVDGSAKASFRSPRLSLGPISGGAVRLAPAGELLLIGEGIETSASAMQATGQPAWAALSAGGIERLILPQIVSTVIILADNDVSGAGEAAARAATARWIAEGRRVRIAMPAKPGTDFNDVLLGREHARIQEVCHVD